MNKTRPKKITANLTGNTRSNAWFHVIFIATLFFLFLAACKKEKKDPPAPETGTLSDIEGNVYKTVKIGDQWWMSENLRVTKYNNGDTIQQMKLNAPFGKTDTAWATMKTGACCIYANRPSPLQNGRLYNWYAVNNPRIAPAGWHVPTDEDWKKLEQHLGMSTADAEKTNWRGTDESNKLKTEAPAGWNYNNLDLKFQVWGNNESGFTALAGGCCMFEGRWSEPETDVGFWWTATTNPANDQAWYRHLDYKHASVFRYYGPKSYGFSVRLVKD